MIDSDTWLDGWVTPDDVKPDYGKLPLWEGELLPADGLDEAEPDEQWMSEATGNEGVEIERAYRSAALVLWPRSRAVATLAAGGIGAVVAYVAEDLARSDQSEAERVHLRELAAQVIWTVEMMIFLPLSMNRRRSPERSAGATVAPTCAYCLIVSRI